MKKDAPADYGPFTGNSAENRTEAFKSKDLGKSSILAPRARRTWAIESATEAAYTLVLHFVVLNVDVINTSLSQYFDLAIATGVVSDGS